MSIRRAMLQMMLARSASVGVMAGALMILGRLLTPAEFGVFVAMVAVVGLFEVIVRFGIPQHLIRIPVMPDTVLRAGQGLALVLAVVSAGVLLLAVLLVPASIWPPDGRVVLILLALTLPSLAVTETLEAAFNRDLQVDLVARLTVARQIAESATAVLLALAGFGAVALAIGVVAHRGLGAVGLWWFGRGTHRFHPSVEGWLPFIAFARQFLGMDLAARAGDAGVVAVLTRLLGFDLLGQFNRAKRVISLLDDTLLTGLQPVILPALSRSLDAGVDRARVYLTKVDHLAALCWPAFAFIALMGEEIVLVLLGAQWSAAVPAVQFLALAGLVLPVTKMSAEMFVALDAAALYTRIQIAHQAIRVACVAAGAAVSLEAACLGAALSSYVKAGVISVALKRRTGYDAAALGRVAVRAAGVTFCALAGPVALNVTVGPDWPASIHLGAAGLLAASGWIAGAAITRHALLPEALIAIGAIRIAARLRPEGTQ